MEFTGKYDTIFSIKLQKNMKIALENQAKTLDISVPELVRICINDFFTKQDFKTFQKNYKKELDEKYEKQKLMNRFFIFLDDNKSLI